MSGLSEQERETLWDALGPIADEGDVDAAFQQIEQVVERILAARAEQARPEGLVEAIKHHHGAYVSKWADGPGYTWTCPCGSHAGPPYPRRVTPRLELAEARSQMYDHIAGALADQARPEHVVKAEALREAAREYFPPGAPLKSWEVQAWLRDRADALEVRP